MSKFNPIFRAVIEKGKLKLLDKEKFQLWIDSFNEGQELEVSVGKYRNSRTNAENGYYWAVIVDILANNYGYTPEEMHEVLKLLHNTKTINWKGKEKKIPQSTATLTIQQFEEYCERIRVW